MLENQPKHIIDYFYGLSEEAPWREVQFGHRNPMSNSVLKTILEGVYRESTTTAENASTNIASMIYVRSVSDLVKILASDPNLDTECNAVEACKMLRVIFREVCLART